MKARSGRVGAVAMALLTMMGAAAWSRNEVRAARTQKETTRAASAEKSAEAARLNSLGVARVNQGNYAEGQKLFEQALAADPGYVLAKMNLGVALHSQQKSEEAKKALTEAAKKLPKDPYAWYHLGLALKDGGELEKAIEAFRHVTEIAPEEADAFYFIGYLNTQLQKYDEAIAAFQKTLALAPLHASGEFGLARAYQRKGEAEAAKEHLQKFQRITQQHLGTPFGAGYGDQGKLSLAEYSQNAVTNAPEAVAVKFAAQPMVEVGASTGACFLDYDGDGRADLLLVSANAEGTTRLLHNEGGGKFADATQAAGIVVKGSGLGCAAGDYDNDGKTDVAICFADGVRVFHNEGGGKFAETTTALGIRREKGCAGLTFVDYDHDGDLDLYVTAGEGGRNALWRNNGNSTFTDVTEETALGLEATAAGVATTDFNNDRAIDFVVAGGKNGATVYLNPREGKFAAATVIDFAKEKLPAAVGVVAFDFDKDGWMDLAFTHAGAPGVSLWRNVGGKKLERVALPVVGWTRGWGIAAVDYDNDGWLDLVAAGETKDGGELRLLRNLGVKSWADVSTEVKLDAVKLKEPRAIAVADTRGVGAADLVVTQLGGAPLLLRNEGGAQRNWMRLELRALNDNKSAIGTKVEVYAGLLYQKWEVAGASGYLGQNAPEILVGLGTERSADVVRLLWPTGVPQDELNVASKKTQTIAELDRRGSSCPVLFSWNGKEFEFIADMIGPGVVGHWVAPGERDVPDPDEYLKVPGRAVREKNGVLSFRFMEPMEETVYLDQVKLLAVDHPAGVEVYPNERFASAPPFPEFKIVASRERRAPAGAWDDRGRDVLPLVARADRKYVTEFEELPFAGFAKLHWLELDLGEWDAKKPLRLILEGYTDYFTATSMYAADQAGIKVIAPYVEAQDASGKWTRVVEDMGFPAGLRRTMIADLSGRIPAGTRRIRIANNLKIYWDAVEIDQTPEMENLQATEVPLAKASLEYVGYPRETRLKPASDTTYSYAHRSMSGPYAHAAGNYTRYGDVRELLRKPDDRFVVFGSGEGVKLDFDPRGLPQVRAGWVRDYFFYANGFEKDMDFYAAHAFTVEPLPKHSAVAYPYPVGQEYPTDGVHTNYQLEYNARQRSDRLPARLRYDYAPPK